MNSLFPYYIESLADFSTFGNFLKVFCKKMYLKKFRSIKSIVTQSMKFHSIVFLSLLLISCNQTPEPTPEKSFRGLWSLHIMEEQDPDTGQWSEWKNGMQGYILYDGEDHMAVHLTFKGYQDTELRFPNFVDTIPLPALKHLTGSYVYFAKYSVDREKGVVQHARISHSNPGDWDAVVQRRFHFSGDTLTLQPVEDSNSRLRLKWVRSKPNE
jgi:hypothetical protein